MLIRALLHNKDMDHMVSPVFFAVAHAITVLVFMILGLVLMTALHDDEFCESFYVKKHFSLCILFAAQVLVFIIATLVSVTLAILRIYTSCCDIPQEHQKRYGYEPVHTARASPTTLEKMYI
jgi:predicted membrane protein